MNLDQGRAAVMARGFDYLAPTQLDLMLNTGKDVFEDIYEWPWLWRVFSGPTPFNFPDFKLMLTIASGGAELYGLDVRQAAQDGSDLTERGTPQYWWLESDDILHAYPGDGATVNGIYVADSPPLVAPSDTPLIPARYHGMWVDFAVCEAYKDSDNFAAAQTLRADIGSRMVDVITRYETRNRQHSPFMTMRATNGDD